MSHLFIYMNYIRFHKYYIHVLSTKDILAIKNILTTSWLIKCLINTNTYNHNNIYRKIIFSY